jgi:hypothetical protein
MVAAPIRPAERTILVLISDRAPDAWAARLVVAGVVQLLAKMAVAHSGHQRTTPLGAPVAVPAGVRIRTNETVDVSKMKRQEQKKAPVCDRSLMEDG